MAHVTQEKQEISEYERNSPSRMTLELVREAANYIKARFPPNFKPVAGITCGSGLGGLADALKDAVRIAYKDIPHFPVSLIQGHAGILFLGTLEGRNVLVWQGRAHPYEGNAFWQSALYIWVMRELGANVLLLTNSAGAVNPVLTVGQICVLKDVLDLPSWAGANALVGLHDSRLYDARFIPLSKPFDFELRKQLLLAGRELNIPLVQAVYVQRVGPTYETVVEQRVLYQLGADVVGMSTAYETIVARAIGMRVASLSLVSNVHTLQYPEEERELEALEVKHVRPPEAKKDSKEGPLVNVPSHEEVLEAAEKATAHITQLISALISTL